MHSLLTTLREVPAALISASNPNTSSTDPITEFFDHDWSGVGGWSLFVAISLFIVIGAFREWWAPGGRVRRLENLVASQQRLIMQQSDQIEKLTEGNKFTQYVMEQVVPRPSSRARRSTVAARPAETNDTDGRTP